MSQTGVNCLSMARLVRRFQVKVDNAPKVQAGSAIRRKMSSVKHTASADRVLLRQAKMGKSRTDTGCLHSHSGCEMPHASLAHRNEVRTYHATLMPIALLVPCRLWRTSQTGQTTWTSTCRGKIRSSATSQAECKYSQALQCVCNMVHGPRRSWTALPTSLDGRIVTGPGGK